MAGRDGESVLVISDGGLPGLVACLIGARPSTLTLWLPPITESGGAMTRSRQEAVAEQSRHLKAVVAHAEPAIQAAPGLPPNVVVLLLACREAGRRGCDRVVWPTVCGSDPDRIFAADELAGLIPRLVAVADGAGGPRNVPEIHAPLADLTPRQVADLARDLDAPIDLCWWSHRFGPLGPETDATEERWAWEAALRESGEAALAG